MAAGRKRRQAAALQRGLLFAPLGEMAVPVYSDFRPRTSPPPFIIFSFHPWAAIGIRGTRPAFLVAGLWADMSFAVGSTNGAGRYEPRLIWRDRPTHRRLMVVG